MSAQGPTESEPAEAFASHFQQAGASLWCVAIGILRTREDAEDCLQDAAMIAWRKWSEFESGTSFGSWMARIVRFTALNRGRKRELRRGRSLAVAGEPADRDAATARPSINVESLLDSDQQEFDDRVVSALSHLSEEARTCLLLKVVGELDYAEISKLTDMPEGTAMSHVSRARKQMRERLADQELTA